ncbi:hypothetical protein R1sor_010082 [Riccia sorocarpa]|uniref:HAT C-terminal dimerisation domain-containing protein n=1 Tax=Riccia sorocarpa TaxID=122646 RepID=A0ABD3HYL0_9MARC
MYDAEKQLAEGFKAANVDAMKKAMLKSCDTLQDGRACIWSGMNVVDRALANRKDSIEPKWDKIFSAHQQEARDIAKMMQRPGMQTLSGDWDEESEYQYRAWTLSSSLRRMVISDRWISWANDPQRPPQTRTDAREAKETILDERFWDKVHDIVMMMEKIFVLLRHVDSHKDFLGRVFWESWECQDILKNLHKSTELRSNIITPSSCDELFLLFRHRWNGWTNIIHTTAMLLNPAYLFDEERHEFSYHSFIMRDFQEYVTLFAKGVLQYSGDELVQYLHDVDKELDGITCLDGSIWTHIHREKALSERCRTSPMHWWAQAGRGAPKLRVIAMNILGLTCAASACERAWSSYAYVHSLSRVRLSIPRQHKLVYIYHNTRINNIDQKRERKSAAVLNTFMKSNTQQSILKQRHGTEYGSTSNPRDAWIPDDVLQENGLEIALSNGDMVRLKTWDWTEPVSAEEVLEDTLQARTMRNAPVDGKLPVGSTEPMENIVYYDGLADHDFPDDSEMSLDDSAVLPRMEVRDEDTLDAYFDVTSEVLPMEAIRNYTIVDDIDTTKAWTLGVGQERLKQLNSRFGVARFPHVTLNVPGVTLTTKKTRILQEIYSMPGRRTDSFDLGKPPKRPKHSSSRLKPTERAGTSRQWENVVGPVSPIPDNGVGPSQREEPSSRTGRLLRQLPPVDYRSQLKAANVSRPSREDIPDSAIPVEDNGAGPSQREESSSPRGRLLRQHAPVDYKSQLNPPKLI